MRYADKISLPNGLHQQDYLWGLPMNYFSMFSGIGGFELGIRQSEIKSEDSPNSKSGTSQLPGHSLCVGYSEINKYAIQVYEQHFKGHKNYGDATKINANDLPDFDLLVGGFPCQAFSIAGKRLGFGDTRGTLFYDIARILSHKRPQRFLLENVKGLLSHDNGKTFSAIIRILTDLGYCVEWQVLNSKDFGVPQNRERVFFSGHLGVEGFRKVFHIGGIDSGDSSEDKKGRDVAHTITNGEKLRGSYIKESQKLSDAQGQGAKTGLYAIPVLTPDREEKRQNGRRMKEDGDPSFTLTSQDKHGVFDGYRIRRLTPTECERLQGFPDGWTESLSDSQRYKCLGNAVTVNVIEAIMRNILSPNAD